MCSRESLTSNTSPSAEKRPCADTGISTLRFGGGDDTVGNPHRAQIYQLELFELTLLLK